MQGFNTQELNFSISTSRWGTSSLGNRLGRSFLLALPIDALDIELIYKGSIESI